MSSRCRWAGKTAKEAGQRAKADRVRQKHYGGRRRSQGFFRPAGARFDWQKMRYVKESRS